MKKITLVPVAGLCNRMNAILSLMIYKQHNPDCNIEIFWHKTHDCKAHFTELFKQLPAPYTVKKMRSLLKNRPATPRNLFITNTFRRIWYDFQMLPKDKADDFDILTKDKKNIYVSVYNRFNKYSTDVDNLGSIFIPTDEIQQRINDITKDWEKQNVIGLHIRRTDNINAIKNSPLSKFTDYIDKELKQNDSTYFYLASDDEEVKKELNQRYPGRIYTAKLTLKRNSVQGMKDAVVDLYCLGKTKKIIGSTHSTYSILASKLYNIELIV